MAVTYGADAVYLAGREFGMRAGAGNFSQEELKAAAEICRRRGVRVYAACNVLLRNGQAERLPAYLEMLADAGVDGVIVTDLGALRMAQKYAPGLAIHISTQCGVTNYEAASAFYELGAARVILARELTIPEIAEIRLRCPKELELEAFVHGAMCVSFSGRCLLSDYLTGRDANEGACAQPCRWKYRLTEENQSGETLELTEDGGTFLLNSRDLCMIDHIPELLDAGVTSLKIEGRTKSTYYAAVTANAYRHAADAAERGEPLPAVWREEVFKVSHRPYSTGFYYSEKGPGQFTGTASYFADCDVAAQVEYCDGEGNAVLTERNKFSVGDELELLTPDGEPVKFTVGEMRNASGDAIVSAPSAVMEVHLRLPRPAPRYSLLRKYRTGYLTPENREIH